MRLILRCLPLLLMGFACTAAEPPVADNLEAGKHFRAVSPPQPTTDPDKIEVAEVFWYGCPHCFSFEPAVERWRKNDKPDDVIFVKLPATLNKRWRLHARAFYTAEVLGILDRFHPAMFRAMHEQNRPLNTEAKLAEFFAQFGIEKKTFESTFYSFPVESKLDRADRLLRGYKITSVPTVIVNGKYWTNGTLAKSQGGVFKVVDQLIERERR